jgi:hypothetical protein
MIRFARKAMNSLWIIRFGAALSTLYGFWFVFNLNEYTPWQIRTYNGIKCTLLGHLALWLVTLNIRGNTRFAIAALLLLSTFVLFFLWWNLHLAVAVAATSGVAWIVLQVFRGKRLGHRSILAPDGRGTHRSI